ncbi:MAG: hypothetical protein MI700_11835 [Balneolales bacterium]|nr:hypothetical protein [Balneolales bacterium]
MGQQQLLLVILVTIIVGIATVVAITTFGDAADQSNLEAVRYDMINVGASTQGYFIKPVGLGGGGKDFTDMTFRDIAFPADSLSPDGLTAFNENGTFTLEFLSTTSICLTAVPASDATAELHVDIYEEDMLWYDLH